MDKPNPARDKSYTFALHIVKLYQHLCESKREYVLSKQLVRSGTSIGANVAEAINVYKSIRNIYGYARGVLLVEFVVYQRSVESGQ